ncbi:MAG: AbrB/MazE/SpoVT family DNA-binding domain-containing protein [Rhodospirillales bacterium]|nr:MAG: AbrB/MazE/SpoVT family DNA-binding domain-containing protein [Rhodospirillales bacterium]
MKSSLVAIGNSRGIRLPKAVIEQCGFSKQVELEVRNHQLIVRAANELRAGWNEAFAKAGPEELITTPRSDWDDKEWTW